MVGMKKNMVLKYLNFGVDSTPYLDLWVGDALIVDVFDQILPHQKNLNYFLPTSTTYACIQREIKALTNKNLYACIQREIKALTNKNLSVTFF